MVVLTSRNFFLAIGNTPGPAKVLSHLIPVPDLLVSHVYLFGGMLVCPKASVALAVTNSSKSSYLSRSGSISPVKFWSFRSNILDDHDKQAFYAGPVHLSSTDGGGCIAQR